MSGCYSKYLVFSISNIMTEEISDRDRKTVVRIAEKINSISQVYKLHNWINPDLNLSRQQKCIVGFTKLVFIDESLFKFVSKSGWKKHDVGNIKPRQLSNKKIAMIWLVIFFSFNKLGRFMFRERRLSILGIGYQLLRMVVDLWLDGYLLHGTLWVQWLLCIDM